MSDPCIDTNVIIRFLVETPQTIPPKFKGVFSFFAKLEQGLLKAFCADVVVFQSYFVLTSYYGVHHAVASEKLEEIMKFRGITMQDKPVMLDCLRMLQEDRIDIVDAYLLARSRARGATGIFSFDNDFADRKLALLKVE